jgi:hypothetical protein
MFQYIFQGEANKIQISITKLKCETYQFEFITILSKFRTDVAKYTLHIRQRSGPLWRESSRDVGCDAAKPMRRRFNSPTLRGVTMPFKNELKSVIDEQFHSKSFVDIAKAPLGVLGGVSRDQGLDVMDALNVKTIAELATCRHVLWAQAINTLAKQERTTAANPVLADIIDPKWEKSGLRDLAKASPAVLMGLSERGAKLLQEAIGVRTVEELATNRYVLTAQVIANLAKFEKIETLKQAA